MELDFDAAFVEVDEESSGALVRKNSKVYPGKNLKEDVANDTVEPEMERDFVTSGGENIDINSGINSQEEAANRTCKRETKMNMNFAASDEESSSTLVLNTSELTTGRNLKENEANGREIMIRNIEVAFNKVQNFEVKLGGESFEAEQSKVTTVEQTERHENKEYLNGGSTAYPLRMDPSNKSAVLTDTPVDSTHLKASSEPSVYCVEDKGVWKCRHCSWVYTATNPGIELIQKHKEHCEGINNEKVLFEQVFPIKHEFQKGSQITANLDRGSETIDYESKEAEFVMSKMVSQTMTEKQNDQKWPTVEGIWQSDYMDSETSTGAYVTQSFVTGKSNQIENIKNGKSAFLDAHVFCEIESTATVRNGELISNEEQEKTENAGIKEHQHWNNVSKIALQKSQDGFVRAKDEKQLRENQIRILEKSALEENVEDIVKLLKEQQSHDLFCPNCGSCITKRVILRKRKRTSLVSESNNDVQASVSEGEQETTGDQSNREMSIEDDEGTQAYGCLKCFTVFFGRGVQFFQTKSESGKSSLAEQYPSENHQDSRMLVDKEKDSLYCFPFLYPWGHSKPGDKLEEPLLNKEDSDKEIPLALNERNSIGRLQSVTEKEFTEKLPSRTARHPSFIIQNVTSQTSTTTTSTLTYSSRTENAEIKETKYTATEATKSTPYLDGDSESLQLEEHYPRLPNLEMTEGQLTSPPSSSIPTLNGQTGRAEAKFEETNESIPEKKSDMHVQHADELAESKDLEKQHAYQKDVKRTEDKLTELHVSASSASSEEHQQGKTEQHSVYESSKHVDNFSTEVATSMDENRIQSQLVTQGQASNGMSDSAGNKELPRSEHQPDDLERNIVVGKGQSDKKDYLCSCIPVSIPSVWLWSSKELIADEQLKKPLLADLKDKLIIDKEVPVALRDDQQRKDIFSSKLDSVESSSSLETRDPATLVQSKVDDSVWLDNVDDSVSQRSEISPDSRNIVIPTDGRVATVINIAQTVDSQPSNTGTSVSVQPERPNTKVVDLNVVTDWDLLKSIVYGGLTVSITSLGVVSSTAGGEAKTLTVIAIGLANLVAGFFLLITNILYLSHFHQDEFIETVGRRFWFNGFIAMLAYLIFGSLAPITYGFSFQKSDEIVYKFLAASLVSLISIILLALGKARVTKKSYIKIVILYVVTGFWASFIGFFAGKYIKQLLEKWGFTTD